MVYIPTCTLACECLGTALDPSGREIIKTSLAPGREIEKQEKRERKHRGKDVEKGKQREDTQQPNIILIVNELGTVQPTSGCPQRCKRSEETRVGSRAITNPIRQ